MALDLPKHVEFYFVWQILNFKLGSVLFLSPIWVYMHTYIFINHCLTGCCCFCFVGVDNDASSAILGVDVSVTVAVVNLILIL